MAVSVAIATMLQGNHKDKKGHFKVKDVINEAYEHASKCLETDEEKKDLLFYLECEKIKELNLDESKKIGYTYKTMGAGFWALKQSDFRKAITKVMLQVKREFPSIKEDIFTIYVESGLNYSIIQYKIENGNN